MCGNNLNAQLHELAIEKAARMGANLSKRIQTKHLVTNHIIEPGFINEGVGNSLPQTYLTVGSLLEAYRTL